MKVEALNCRCCGGILKVTSALCECEYCGATNLISDTAGRYITQLNRANKLRQEKEYDHAIRIYDKIIEENIPSSDILWLRTLCEYGIEYVPDPISTRYIPTLHRIKEESILQCQNYLDALDLCDDEQKEIIRSEAETIDKIQRDYLDIAKNEAPYDVFICYKQTDDDTGELTEDTEYANELYEILVKEGFKVFFAKITLQSKLSVDYEPYIFAALRSARAMAVIGTKSEYFTATWVKNEWSRFLKFSEKDTSKKIFFACDDPEELPRAFSMKQAQVLGDKNAIFNLAQNIKTHLLSVGKEEVKNVNEDAGTLYQKALKDVNASKFYEAMAALNKCLESHPTFSEAYWLRLVARNKCTLYNITNKKLNFSQDEDFLMAVKFASPEKKSEYEEACRKCLANIELQRKFDNLLNHEVIKHSETRSDNEPSVQRSYKMNDIRKKFVERDKMDTKARIVTSIGFTLYILGIALSMGSDFIYQDGMLYAVLIAGILLSGALVHMGLGLLFTYNPLMDIILNTIILVERAVWLVNMLFGNPKLNISTFIFFEAVLLIGLPAVFFALSFFSYERNHFRKQISAINYENERAIKEVNALSKNIVNDFLTTTQLMFKSFIADNHAENVEITFRSDAYRDYKDSLEKEGANLEKEIMEKINGAPDGKEGKESYLGITSLLLCFAPLVNFIALPLAFWDISSCKRQNIKHNGAVMAILLGMTVLFLGYVISTIR